MAVGDFLTKHLLATTQSILPTAPTSPLENGGNEDEDIERLTNELEATSIKRKRADLNALTPPRSSGVSASSSTQTESEDALCTRRRSSGRSPSGRHLSTSDGVALPNRRVASGLNPLSAITTDSSVPAPQFSNPTSLNPSISPDPSACAAQELSAQSSLVSCLENVKLTEDVASPRTKNTPPHTPRALSNDGSENIRRSAAATATPRSNQSPSRDPKNGNLPGGPLRGRLLVKISEARGLRPCYDPYAVCVFEWNESIAKNDSQEGVEMERDDSRGRESSLGGLLIDRSASGMGRSMAIPMKSRQSSTTSLSEKKKFKSGNSQVTAPRWDHETML